MTTSVNTNMSAMVALQNLNATTRDLAGVQNRINTGLKVAGAKDNAAVYAVAQNMRGDIASLGSVKTSLNRATAVADVALAAAESISDTLVRMRELVIAARDPSISTSSRQAYDRDFQALKRQISSIVNNANFDGTNILNASITSGVNFLADADGVQTLTLGVENLRMSSANITLTNASNLTTATNAATALGLLDTSLNNVNAALARLGASSKRIEAHTVFITKLMDSLTGGVGNLVDADLAVESARLQALQVKQQLGTQALSIANQAPQVILNLFRGG
jgi:flagellin